MKRLLLVLLLAFALPASATVNSTQSRLIVLGNGSQTAFTFNFIGVSAAYIGVLLTDSAGVQTSLTQGPGTTQFQVTLNAPVQGAIWGLGGTVTYNPSGTPIPAGSTLTIYRTLPLTQAITLQNLPSIAVLGKGSETGLDMGVLEGQQINDTIGRAIVANPANSVAPLPLPPAAQAANQALIFDSTGNNVIAGAIPSSGVISSAMQPVVSSATLALGRTAFGLGTMAQENINAGTCGGSTIQDDGSGNARVVFGLVSDATNQTVTCAFSQTQRVAAGPVIYTLPRSNTLFAGFGFKVYVVSSTVTFTPNVNDSFQGMSSGASVTASAGSVCSVATNIATSGTWQINCNNSPPSLSASASANALTLSLNATLINFRDPTLANGDPLWAIPGSTIAVTIPSGATLGTSNGVPFRIWIFVAYNAGVPILGVATCSNSSQIFACASRESQQNTGMAISSGAGTAGTLYTSVGTTNDSVRIIGYAEYSSGLGTAGTWASGPTKLQICIPPFACKKPGESVQVVAPVFGTLTVTNFTTGTTSTNVTASITPTSPINLIKYAVTTTSGNTNSTTNINQLYRGSTAIGVIYRTYMASTNIAMVLSFFGYDTPYSASSVTYTVKASTPSGTGSIPAQNTDSATEVLEEIMGSLDPSNDNALLKMTG